MPSDVQDALVTVLVEKTLPVPELASEVQAVPGFNLIATANDRDRGINDLSAALRRRFNTVVLPLPADPDEEVAIVRRRVAEMGVALQLPKVPPADEEIRRVVTVFRELRGGATEDGRVSLKVPSGSLSTAEAISVVTNGLALAAHFGDGTVERRRRRRRDRRRRGQGPGARRRRLARVPRGCGARSCRVGASSTKPAASCTADDSMTRGRPCKLLGIRHHGPGSARSLVAALDELRPECRAGRAAGRLRGVVGVGRSRASRPAGRLARLRASTIRSVPRSCRSPSSARSGRRSRWAHAPRRRWCGRSTCRCASRWPHPTATAS